MGIEDRRRRCEALWRNSDRKRYRRYCKSMWHVGCAQEQPHGCGEREMMNKEKGKKYIGPIGERSRPVR